MHGHEKLLDEYSPHAHEQGQIYGASSCCVSIVVSACRRRTSRPAKHSVLYNHLSASSVQQRARSDAKLRTHAPRSASPRATILVIATSETYGTRADANQLTARHESAAIEDGRRWSQVGVDIRFRGRSSQLASPSRRYAMVNFFCAGSLGAASSRPSSASWLCVPGDHHHTRTASRKLCVRPRRADILGHTGGSAQPPLTNAAPRGRPSTLGSRPDCTLRRVDLHIVRNLPLLPREGRRMELQSGALQTMVSEYALCHICSGARVRGDCRALALVYVVEDMEDDVMKDFNGWEVQPRESVYSLLRGARDAREHAP